MLYKRWCRIAGEYRHETALCDTASGRRWTFGELHAVGESWPLPGGNIVHPMGHTPEFLFALLAAWRERRIVCPLETGQVAPQIPSPPGSIVHLKSTSATTGNSRLVAFTAEQLAADAENIVTTMGLRRDWTNLGVISMAHSYGFSNLVLPLLLHGIPLTLVPSPLPENLRSAARGETALTLPAVPAMWRAWITAQAIPTNVRLAISAGAPLPVSLECDVLEAMRLKIHNFYGSSECGGIAYDESGSPRTDEAFAGRPMRNVNLNVNETGCLAVRSRAVGETYWPDASETLAGGVFHTSDLAELNAGGVFLRGRASDLINVAGRKVSPLLIEHELMQHPAVNACLVFSVPASGADRSDLVVACVVKECEVGQDTLRHFLLERLPAWQLPRDWWFVESLLPNRVGKISRAEWRKRYFEHQQSAQQPG